MFLDEMEKAIQYLIIRLGFDSPGEVVEDILQRNRLSMIVERAAGVEPAPTDWKPVMLTVEHHARTADISFCLHFGFTRT